MKPNKMASQDEFPIGNYFGVQVSFQGAEYDQQDVQHPSGFVSSSENQREKTNSTRFTQ